MVEKCSPENIFRNICPNTIYVTARGAWKLGGLEHSGEATGQDIVVMFGLFLEKMGDGDSEVLCPAWTTKTPKAAQPNLNYIGG